MIFEAVLDSADMGAVVGFPGVVNAEERHALAQLLIGGHKAVFRSNVKGDGVELFQIRDVLIQHGERGVRVPRGQYLRLDLPISRQTIEEQRRIFRR